MAETHALPFPWHSFDLRSRFLPEGWQQEILEVARVSAEDKYLVPSYATSREADSESQIPVHTVDGVSIAEELPWLYSLYRQQLRDMAQTLTREEVTTATDVRTGLTLNVQRGSQERYECHVDWNPLSGLLYVTDHPRGSGGELLVSNRGDVHSCEEVDADCTRIYPVAGHALFFDGRYHSHYVNALRNEEDVRVVLAMNFYTASHPEKNRPESLDRHLGLLP